MSSQDPKANPEESDDDDIPDLEDMSEQIQRLKVSSGTAPLTKTLEPPAPRKNPTHPPKPKPDYTLTIEEETASRLAHQNALDKKLGEAFAKSMQSQPVPKPKPAPKNPNITSVKAKDPKANPLELKEVQQNMSMADNVMGSKDKWLTPDLLGMVQKDPKLLEGFADPEVMAAVTMMQTDPKGAMAKYGGNPKVRDFIKVFSGMMGNHFEKIAETESKSKPQAPPKVKTEAEKVQEREQVELEKKLADPMVKKIFEEPTVQNFIRHLQTSKEPVDFYE